MKIHHIVNDERCVAWNQRKPHNYNIIIPENPNSYDADVYITFFSVCYESFVSNPVL